MIECGQKLWKFMPLGQFLDIIVNKRIWFPSLYALKNLDDAVVEFSNIGKGIDLSATLIKTFKPAAKSRQKNVGDADDLKEI